MKRTLSTSLVFHAGRAIAQGRAEIRDARVLFLIGLERVTTAVAEALENTAQTLRDWHAVEKLEDKYAEAMDRVRQRFNKR